jgi:hypothetical protein
MRVRLSGHTTLHPRVTLAGVALMHLLLRRPMRPTSFLGAWLHGPLPPRDPVVTSSPMRDPVATSFS